MSMDSDSITQVEIKYKPRYPRVHEVLDKTRFVVLVAHRRFGKTVLSVNQLLKQAVTCPLEHGSYAYVAPFRNQAKEIAWGYLKRFSETLPDRNINESELSITLFNGSRIRLFGADNPDALRGMYFDGIILDEVAQMRREVWQEIIRPALADRNGWALFIGTPKGENLFYELFQKANEDLTGNWKALTFKVTDTNAISPTELADLRSEMSENAFRQEFMCDFSASNDDVLITLDDAQKAMSMKMMANSYERMPKVFGVDIARFGEDSTVVFIRQGLRAFEPIVVRQKDNVEVAEMIVSLYHREKPEAIYVDAGQGQGVIDILRRVLPCVSEIPFGSKALDDTRFINRRSEMWYAMREWIKSGGWLPNNPQLLGELTAPLYSFNLQGKIQLEKKDEIKKRIGRSPDIADALALTFAYNLLPSLGNQQQYADTAVDVFARYVDEEVELYADGVQKALI